MELSLALSEPVDQMMATMPATTMDEYRAFFEVKAEEQK